MTIAVIGGGPTGVELAGSIADLARYTLAKDFHRIRVENATVLLWEAGDHLLPAFPEALASYVQRKLERLGVKVRFRAAVECVARSSITMAGKRLVSDSSFGPQELEAQGHEREVAPARKPA